VRVGRRARGENVLLRTGRGGGGSGTKRGGGTKEGTVRIDRQRKIWGKIDSWKFDAFSCTEKYT
jgi:hypothetical protein